MQSIAPKFGCSAETLRKWVRREERDSGRRPGPTSDQLARLKERERENRELRRRTFNIVRPHTALGYQPTAPETIVPTDLSSTNCGTDQHTLGSATMLT